VNAAEFNALYEVGVPVFAYPGFRPEDVPSTRRLVTRTRSAAQSVGLDREGVVWVEGHGAYIALTHVDVVTEDEWVAAKDTEAAGAPTDPSSPEFFRPGHTYEFGEHRFQCVHLVAHPAHGGVVAWGWFGRVGTGAWRHASFSRRQFAARAWDDVTEMEVSR
jgi:hypothetical protein